MSVVAEALSSGGCPQVAAVTRPGHLDGMDLATLGVSRVILDQWADEGPFAGVLSALEELGDVDVVVLSCDLPLVTPGTVSRLISTEGPVAVADDGRLQPLVACYRSEAVELLREAWDAGERSLRRTLDVAGAARVPVEPGELDDVDTVEQEAELRRRADLTRLQG